VTAYLDASALVKCYVVEFGSRETLSLIADSEISATSIVSRAEVAAALAKAARTGLLTQNRARSAQRAFAGDWPDLVRVRSPRQSWNGPKRLPGTTACAAIGTEIVLATFDRQLWEAAPNGMAGEAPRLRHDETRCTSTHANGRELTEVASRGTARKRTDRSGRDPVNGSLDHGIGVRIPASQPTSNSFSMV
jgi:uncharacterized protein